MAANNNQTYGLEVHVVDVGSLEVLLDVQNAIMALDGSDRANRLSAEAHQPAVGDSNLSAQNTAVVDNHETLAEEMSERESDAHVTGLPRNTPSTTGTHLVTNRSTTSGGGDTVGPTWNDIPASPPGPVEVSEGQASSDEEPPEATRMTTYLNDEVKSRLDRSEFDGAFAACEELVERCGKEIAEMMKLHEARCKEMERKFLAYLETGRKERELAHQARIMARRKEREAAADALSRASVEKSKNECKISITLRITTCNGELISVESSTEDTS